MNNLTVLTDNEILNYHISNIRHCCVTCNHCAIVNRNKVYAVCDESGKVFFLWGEDARKFTCDRWEDKKLFISFKSPEEEDEHYLSPQLKKD